MATDRTIRIDWRVILHKHQRYETSADWFWSDDGTVLNIRVSRMSDPRYEFCLGLHELMEAMFCTFQGVPQELVDDFDMPFEAAHGAGAAVYPCGCSRTEYSDPGSDPHAPYQRQHLMALGLEYAAAAFLHIDRATYDAEVDSPPK